MRRSTSLAQHRIMEARVVTTLIVGCLMLTEIGVAGKTVSERTSQISNGSNCLKTIIANNGDTTKFSFEVPHPAAKVTHCQWEAGEKDLWTIESLSTDDILQDLELKLERALKGDKPGLTITNAEWEIKMDQLLETVAKLEKRIEEIIVSSSTPMVGGYQKIGNLSGWYKMHSVGMTWIQAKNKCEIERAHLLVINNAEEQDVVPALFSQNPNIQGADWNDWAWIGVHDNTAEGEFRTVLGERLNSIGFSNWVNGRPIWNAKENCVSVNKLGSMYDSDCGKTAPFICEM